MSIDKILKRIRMIESNDFNTNNDDEVFFKFLEPIKKIRERCLKKKKIEIKISPAEPVIKLEEYNMDVEKIFKVQKSCINNCEASCNFEEKGFRNSVVDMDEISYLE